MHGPSATWMQIVPADRLCIDPSADSRPAEERLPLLNQHVTQLPQSIRKPLATTTGREGEKMVAVALYIC
jgi:hypothetical protein